MAYNDNNKELSMKWFNFYTSIMLIFCILHVLSMSIYANYFTQGIYNYYIISLFIIDLSIVLYEFSVYFSLQKKEKNSINKLIVLLFINFGLKSICTSIRTEGNFTQNLIIITAIFSIYYIPNIIYFIKRNKFYYNNFQENVSTPKEEKPTRFKYKKYTTKKNIKTKNKHNINYKLISIISISLLVIIFLFIGIYFLVNYISSLKNQIQSSQASYNSIKTKYEKLQSEYSDKKNEYSKKDVKLDFYDKHIVFVLDGYGNYYYTYDDMKQVTQGKKYSGWIYTKEEAIEKGYQPFSDNSKSSWEKYKEERNLN